MFLTEQELADRIKLTVSAIRQWRKYKRTGPPYLKIGAAVRYRLEDVEAWEKTLVVSHSINKFFEDDCEVSV